MTEDSLGALDLARRAIVDYLYTSFTNATAFSPTDTMPLSALGEVADARPVAGVALDDRHGRRARA